MAQDSWRTSEARVDSLAPSRALSKDMGEKKAIEDALSLVGQPTQSEAKMKDVTSPQKPIKLSPQTETNVEVSAETTLGQCLGNITIGKGAKEKNCKRKRESPSPRSHCSRKYNGPNKRRCEHSTLNKTEACEGSVVVARQHRWES